MRKNLQKVTALLGAAALTLSLTACGGSGDNSSSGNSDAAAENTDAAADNVDAAEEETADAADTQESGGEDISGSLTVWEHNYSFEPSVKAVIEGFEAKYPNVTVDYEIRDDNYYSILATAIQSGDGPDLFWTNGSVNTGMSDYVTNGVCEDLTDKVDYSLMPEAAMGLTRIDGKSYSVPWLTMDTRTAYYNIDMFEENGWTVPATFPEFEELLGKIKDAGIIPISLTPNDSWALLFAFEPILAAYDVECTEGFADYPTPVAGDAVRGCLNKMLEWGEKGYYGDNWLGVMDSHEQVLAFSTGATAMMVQGSWEASTISENNPDLNYGAFTIPAEDGTVGLVGTPANGFSVNSASENLEAALAFANYCATLEGQTLWVQSQGAVSASEQIEASTDIAKMISESGKGNIYTSWQSVLSYHSENGVANDIFGEDFSKVFTGSLSVDDFCDSIEAVMDPE